MEEPKSGKCKTIFSAKLGIDRRRCDDPTRKLKSSSRHWDGRPTKAERRRQSERAIAERDVGRLNPV